jgi:restriction endonuclease Mrr
MTTQSKSPTEKRPRLSGYEWDLLEYRGHVCGLPREHWYEVFLSHDDTDSLARLAEFYVPPSDHTEQLIELVTDARVLDYFSSRPDDILDASPRQFEILFAEMLDRLGYKDIQLGIGNKDGGVDITAYIEHAFAVERVIVQCKRFTPPHKVGEPYIKQLLTDVDLRSAARGLIVTTTTLTKPAHLLVESFRHRLTHIEGDELRKLLIQFRTTVT